MSQITTIFKPKLTQKYQFFNHTQFCYSKKQKEMLTQLSIIKMFYKSLNIFVRKFEKKEKREENFLSFQKQKFSHFY